MVIQRAAWIEDHRRQIRHPDARAMDKSSKAAYLIDVDNTLLDSDQIIDDLRRHLASAFPEPALKRYWDEFDRLQEEHGFADYLGALQRCRRDDPCDQNFFKISLYLLEYPFSERLFPKALDVVSFLSTLGTSGIVTNGDVVFQPWKIARSGLMSAIGNRVFIDIHKERDWSDVEKRFPAEHYFVFDDELHVLTAAKRKWKDRTTTVFVRQGRHTHDRKRVEPYPAADVTIESIGELLEEKNRRLLQRK